MQIVILILLLFLYLMISTLTVSASRITNEKYCDFKGVAVYTEAYNYEAKKEEAIIFLHGLGGNHIDGWFLHNTENKYMTISMDLLNHGQSGKLENLTWDTYVDSVKAVIDAYNVKKVHLVGHSLGADIAMMYANKYSKDVIDLVLLDRSYYNFSDVKEFNFTPSFYKVIEYNPNSGMDRSSFSNLIDMLLNNDITKTWNIEKDVLLVAANPYWSAPGPGEQSIVDYITMIKQSPVDFGISTLQAASLPNLTLDNLYCYMEFLKNKIDEFTLHNNRFHMVQTPFEHAMVNNDSAKAELSNYVLEFIMYQDKNIATANINKRLKENEGKFNIRSLKDVLG